MVVISLITAKRYNQKTAFVEAIGGLLMKINTEQMEKQFQFMFSLKFQNFEKSQLVTG